MRSWSIGEVARRAGVRPSAIRYYESAGLLPQPARVGGRRRYGAEVLRRLAAIEFGQRAGFSLAEIRTLFAGGGSREHLRAQVELKLIEVEDWLRQAREMKRLLQRGLRCGCTALEKCELLGASAR